MSDNETPRGAAPVRDAAETIRLILSWIFVGAPAIWGMYKVAQEAAKIFR